MRRFVIALAAVAMLIMPASALAVDPTASPSASAAPTVAPTPEPSLRPVPVTVPAGQLGALVAPVPLIATGPSDTGGIFRVDNPSALAEHFVITVADYTIDAQGNPARDAQGNPTTDVPGYAYASAAWYSFPVSDFVLPSGTGRDLAFNLNVPADALPGDHIAALIVTFDAAQTGPAPSGGVGLKTTGKILTRLQHRVAGALPGVPDITVRVNLDNDQPAGIHFVASIDNTGTTVLDYKTGKSSDPLPEFRLYRVGSQDQVACLVVAGGFYVLPEGNRIVTVDWPSPNAQGSPGASPTPSATPAPSAASGDCQAGQLPYTGTYRAVLWLPARDGRNEITTETTFDYVNTTREAPPDYTWLIVAGVVGALLIAGLIVLLFLLASRRRREREESGR